MRRKLAVCAGAAMISAFGLALAGNSSSANQTATPPNDNFIDAHPVELLTPPHGKPHFVHEQSTLGATLEEGESASCGDIGASVWFEFNPPFTAPLEIDTSGSDFDTMIAAYWLSDFYPSPPGDSLEEVICTNFTSGPDRLELVPSVAGRALFIQVGGAAGATGTLRLRVGCALGCPPFNDSFDNRTFVEALPFGEQVITTVATVDADEDTTCGSMGATVWYQVDTSRDDITLSVNTEGSDVATAIAIYTLNPLSGPIPSLTRVDCVTSSGGTGALLEVKLDQGVGYFVQIAGAVAATGTISVQMTCSLGICELHPPLPSDGEPLPIPTSVAGTPGGGGGAVIGPDAGNGGYKRR